MGSVISKPKCVICDEKAETVLFPCGHYCLCKNCAEKMSNDPSFQRRAFINLHALCQVKCPICRTVSVVSKVYT